MSVYSGNVSETMETVRYLFHKYKWMAADVDNKQVLRKEKDFAFQAPITGEEMDQIVNLYKKGLTVKQIAAQVKRSQPSCYWVLKERKIFKGKSSKSYTIEEKKRLIALALSERSITSAAKKYNVSYKSLNNWINEYK